VYKEGEETIIGNIRDL